jgi:hypothetical protein
LILASAAIGVVGLNAGLDQGVRIGPLACWP